MAKQRKLQQELLEDEALLWTGAPCEDKDYGKIDRVLLPLFALLLGLSTFYLMFVIFSVVRFGFEIRHLIDLALVLLVGGYCVYGYFFRFSGKRRAKGDVVYGVTNLRRVLIRDTVTGRTTVVEGRALRDAYISEIDKNGVGTIYFFPKRFGNLFDNTGLDFWGEGIGAQRALFDIPECEKVLKLIRGKR